jgi:hypothetical protein
LPALKHGSVSVKTLKKIPTEKEALKEDFASTPLIIKNERKGSSC